MHLTQLAAVDLTKEWWTRHGAIIAATIVVAIIALKIIGVLSRRLQTTFTKDAADAEANSFAQTAAASVRWTLVGLILAGTVVVILSQLGVQMTLLFARIWGWVLSSGISVAVIILLAFVALRAVRFVATRLLSLLTRDKDDLEAKKRAETLGSVVRWVLRTGILLVAALMVLDELGVQIGPVIAAVGVVGLAVGFGAQNLVSDVISGFFILLEDQVRVGDVVQLDGRGGLVEKITLRIVVLRDLAGNVHFVRNGNISVVTNMTKEYSRYVFDIGVAYREDVDEVIKVIKAVDDELRQDPAFKNDILQPIEVLGLDQFADSAVIIKARTTTKPIQQWRVGREFNRRLKKKFDEVGIEIPFPHLTLYPGKDKQGQSPSLRLDVEGALRKS